MKVLPTGAAGFIGMHTALRLLARGDQVVGFDTPVAEGVQRFVHWYQQYTAS